MEIFKDIEGWEGLYQVSNYGNVKSLSRPKKFKNGTFGKTRELIMAPGFTKGYYSVSLRIKDRLKVCRINRLVAAAFVENPHNKDIVGHLDNNPLNNRADNLVWCTIIENVEHCIKSGNFVNNGTGADNHLSKKIGQIQNGIVVKTWANAKLAADELNLKYRSINNSARGNQPLFGYNFLYL